VLSNMAASFTFLLAVMFCSQPMSGSSSASVLRVVGEMVDRWASIVGKHTFCGMFTIISRAVGGQPTLRRRIVTLLQFIRMHNERLRLTCFLYYKVHWWNSAYDKVRPGVASLPLWREYIFLGSNTTPNHQCRILVFVLSRRMEPYGVLHSP